MRKVTFYGLVLLALVTLSPIQAKADQTVFLDYDHTSCTMVGAAMDIDGHWTNTNEVSIYGHDNEQPIFGVSWHCVNTYGGAIFYDTTLCKCLKTIRAADQTTVNDSSPYHFTGDPFPTSDSGFGCI
jgi:hypothetical protein